MKTFLKKSDITNCWRSRFFIHWSKFKLPFLGTYIVVVVQFGHRITFRSPPKCRCHFQCNSAKIIVTKCPCQQSFFVTRCRCHQPFHVTNFVAVTNTFRSPFVPVTKWISPNVRTLEICGNIRVNPLTPFSQPEIWDLIGEQRGY